VLEPTIIPPGIDLEHAGSLHVAENRAPGCARTGGRLPAPDRPGVSASTCVRRRRGVRIGYV